jgi:hypothetical protein
MNWDCIDSDRRLSDCLEGLTTPEETAAFDAHLKNCAQCAALVSRVGGTVRMLQSAPAVDVPPQLFRRIIGATSGAREPARGWRRWVRPAATAWQPQFAMGAITVAASFLIIFHAANSSHHPQNFETLNPLNLVRAADRQAHLAYAHTAKFVNDMRLVYEIEARIEPDQNQETQPLAPPEQQNTNPESQPKSEVTPHHFSRAIRGRGYYAVFSDHSFGFPADIQPVSDGQQESTPLATPDEAVIRSRS